MSTHNICFHREIRKISVLSVEKLKEKKSHIWSNAHFRLFLSNFFTFSHHKSKMTQQTALYFIFRLAYENKKWEEIRSSKKRVFWLVSYENFFLIISHKRQKWLMINYNRSSEKHYQVRQKIIVRWVVVHWNLMLDIPGSIPAQVEKFSGSKHVITVDCPSPEQANVPFIETKLLICDPF